METNNNNIKFRLRGANKLTRTSLSDSDQPGGLEVIVKKSVLDDLERNLLRARSEVDCLRAQRWSWTARFLFFIAFLLLLEFIHAIPSAPDSELRKVQGAILIFAHSLGTAIGHFIQIIIRASILIATLIANAGLETAERIKVFM
jgi:hypothetical protein